MSLLLPPSFTKNTKARIYSMLKNHFGDRIICPQKSYLFKLDLKLAFLFKFTHTHTRSYTAKSIHAIYQTASSAAPSPA